MEHLQYNTLQKPDHSNILSFEDGRMVHIEKKIQHKRNNKE